MDVFVFPLVNVALFPKTTKPLNIFEPRYLEMIKTAAETKTPVALAFIEDPSLVGPVSPGEEIPFVRQIAGYGEVQIVEERDNGTVLVFVLGRGKCKLGKVKKTDTPYMVCEATPIQENLAVDPELQDHVLSLNRILARWISTHIPDPQQRDLFLQNLAGPEEIIGAFSMYLIRDYDLQQMALEFDSMNEKIRFLYRLAESSEITA